MNFKVTKQLTNTRPEKSTSPEVSTTPTKGNLKLNTAGAEKLGLSMGDYAMIVEAEDENGKGFYIVKGHKGDKENGIAQAGAVLASTSGKEGSSLQFSSENAYRSLGGSESGEKQVYSIGEAVVSEGVSYFKLDFARAEARQVRKPKATA